MKERKIEKRTLGPKGKMGMILTELTKEDTGTGKKRGGGRRNSGQKKELTCDQGKSVPGKSSRERKCGGERSGGKKGIGSPSEGSKKEIPGVCLGRDLRSPRNTLRQKGSRSYYLDQIDRGTVEDCQNSGGDAVEKCQKKGRL